MRTDEERIREMHRVASDMERSNQAFRGKLIVGLSAAACLAIVIGLSALLAGISGTTIIPSDAVDMNASIFSGSNVHGFIVIGILSFVLGIAFTIFCYRLTKQRQGKPYDREP